MERREYFQLDLDIEAVGKEEGDVPKSSFKYMGKYSNWVKLIKGEIDPIQGYSGKFFPHRFLLFHLLCFQRLYPFYLPHFLLTAMQEKHGMIQ